MVKVSIVIPAYNVEHYIGKAIKSVFSQTLDDWELIIVNDGSTDCTEAVVQQYLDKDQRLKYLKQDNKGVSAARNLGMDIAKGKYISFLDADDFYHPEYLRLMTQSLETKKTTMVFCKYREFKDGHIITETPKDVVEIYNNDFIEHLFKIDKVHNMSLMYDLSNLKENKVRFREGCPNGEDRMFVIKAAFYSKISFVAEYLYSYLYREGSASKSYMSYNKYFLMLDGYYGLEKEFENYPKTQKLSHYLNYINIETLGVQNDLRRKIWNELKTKKFDTALKAIKDYESRYKEKYNVRYQGLKKILMFPKMKVIRSKNVKLWRILFF